MKQKFLPLLLVLFMALAACQSSTTTPEATDALNTAQENAAPQEEATASQPTEPVSREGAADFTASGTGDVMDGCTLSQSLFAEPSEEDISKFRPVTEDDHVFGPPDAAVTIIEYGDFQ